MFKGQITSMFDVPTPEPPPPERPPPMVATVAPPAAKTYTSTTSRFTLVLSQGLPIGAHVASQDGGRLAVRNLATGPAYPVDTASLDQAIEIVTFDIVDYGPLPNAAEGASAPPRPPARAPEAMSTRELLLSIYTLLERPLTMPLDLQALIDETTNTTGVEAGAMKVLNAYSDEIASLKAGDPTLQAQINAIVTKMKAGSAPLAAAIAAPGDGSVPETPPIPTPTPVPSTGGADSTSPLANTSPAPFPATPPAPAPTSTDSTVGSKTLGGGSSTDTTDAKAAADVNTTVDTSIPGVPPGTPPSTAPNATPAAGYDVLVRLAHTLSQDADRTGAADAGPSPTRRGRSTTPGRTSGAIRSPRAIRISRTGWRSTCPVAPR